MATATPRRSATSFPGSRRATSTPVVERYCHGDVSPCEKYLVTWSPESDQSVALVVWDIAKGEKCRSFQGAKPDGDIEWPAFHW